MDYDSISDDEYEDFITDSADDITDGSDDGSGDEHPIKQELKKVKRQQQELKLGILPTYLAAVKKLEKIHDERIDILEAKYYSDLSKLEQYKSKKTQELNDSFEADIKKLKPKMLRDIKKQLKTTKKGQNILKKWKDSKSPKRQKLEDILESIEDIKEELEDRNEYNFRTETTQYVNTRQKIKEIKKGLSRKEQNEDLREIKNAVIEQNKPASKKQKKKILGS